MEKNDMKHPSSNAILILALVCVCWIVARNPNNSTIPTVLLGLLTLLQSRMSYHKADRAKEASEESADLSRKDLKETQDAKKTLVKVEQQTNGGFTDRIKSALEEHLPIVLEKQLPEALKRHADLIATKTAEKVQTVVDQKGTNNV